MIMKCIKYLRVSSVYNQSVRVVDCHYRTQRDSESQNVLVLWALDIILIDKEKIKQACS